MMKRRCCNCEYGKWKLIKGRHGAVSYYCRIDDHNIGFNGYLTGKCKRWTSNKKK